MAFVLFKDNVKQRLGLSGLSCSSAASTSVVASGRAIDRHSPRLRDPHRRLPPSLPKPPAKAKQPSSPRTTPKDYSPTSPMAVEQLQPSHNHGGSDNTRRTSAARSSTSENKKKKKGMQQESPASSSRFLLNSSRLQLDDDVTVVESLDSFDDDVFPGRVDGALPLHGAQEAPPLRLADSPAGSSAPWSLSSETAGGGGASDDAAAGEDGKTAITRSCSTRARQHQVVVLRVSLHCKGCAGKVKKHISKMEGVTSFDIDIATKKVTVAGDVTPLGVLNSISKVKSAQFWPATSSSPPRASASF
ncbi:hypothetical protein ACP70R_044386 [Stipagrostis hirtigluma subsp. patula]